MSEKRDSFIFYRSFSEAIRELPDSDRLALYEAIHDFSLEFIEPAFKGIPKAIWTLIRPQLEANNKRFANGSKPKKPKEETTKPEAKNKQSVSKTEANNNVNVNDNVNKNVNDVEKRKTEFKNSLRPYLEKYGKEMLTEFFDYWIEKSPKGKKMRFEKEKVFDPVRRLQTWHARNKESEGKDNFGKTKQTGPTYESI